MLNNNYELNSNGIIITNPSFKLINDSYEENGNKGKLFHDVINSKIFLFEVDQPSKMVLYKGRYHSWWEGNTLKVSCSKCNDCQKDCRVDVVYDENNNIVAVKITRIIE